ncbi:peptidase (M20 family protein) [Desulforapulum autotrophicum HRM2]|uniref:Peptidase (M20 family protein) n=1 Tax=Desulforapulum autotrophicum (strain ATCC 43914 / DSM 3382 / VKM B-1955 / HRM2) TaxID=177437 RepID=C0Q8R0_DESAH|nr:M20 family metallopeptidase [Desulforapulum autotrophicum]ACN14400.1 peptidase (M20 family protein) [Desulforapulum autotrophicum HRM2]
MTRETAIKRVRAQFDTDIFFDCLAALVAQDTGSRALDRKPQMVAYLKDHMVPWLERMDFDCRMVENPVEVNAPFLIARRMEDKDRPTVLIYGHGDTVPAMADKWQAGLDPLALTRQTDPETGQVRWYGRGAADNKGQHAINLMALECVLKEKGCLGFNVVVLVETGEESGSPGLHKICEQEREALKADVLFASDGPRIDPDTPTIFGGSRAVFNFDLEINPREVGHHSGNWGGLLANPGIQLAHAIASMVDARGKILVEALRPEPVPAAIQAAVDILTVAGKGGPAIDPEWGEPGLTAAQKVYAWNTLDVLAFECGDPAQPVNAIPPRAWARCHVRFLAGVDPTTFIPAIRAHLDINGFSMVNITEAPNNYGLATRMTPDNPWVKFARASIEQTLGKTVAFLPNLGGTLPNDAFSHVIGMDTIWIPHSYGGCCQHAPNEHVLASITREGLCLMTGLFWDIGEK